MSLLNLNFEQYSIVQDNCQVHKARIIQNYFEENRIKCITWPAKSPDLNVIENVWKMISDVDYNQCQPLNKIDLERRVNDAVLIINRTGLYIYNQCFFL